MLKKFVFPLLGKSLIKKGGEKRKKNKQIVFNKQALNYYDETVNTSTSSCLHVAL